MTILQKAELVALLHLYMAEVADKASKADNRYGFNAQYNHARILASKLSCEVGKELGSRYTGETKK